jgi:hypothetical protein
MDREILKAALAPGPDCLPLEQLGRYADAALDVDEQTAAAAHIRSCPNCQAELALMKAFTSSALQPDEGAVVSDGIARLERRTPEIAGGALVADSPGRRWSPFNAARAAVVAAAVLLVAVAGAFVLRSPTPPALPATVNAGDDVTRSQTISVRGPIGDLRESPGRFEWMAVDRASRYRVRLMEVDRREVWSASTATTTIELPPEVRALSVPSKTLVWDVTAYDSSGVAIAESGSQAFRLTPR